MRRVSLSILMLSLATVALPAHGQAVVYPNNTRVDISAEASADTAENGSVADMNDDAADNGTTDSDNMSGDADTQSNMTSSTGADAADNGSVSDMNNDAADAGTTSEGENRIDPQKFDATTRNNTNKRISGSGEAGSLGTPGRAGNSNRTSGASIGAGSSTSGSVSD